MISIFGIPVPSPYHFEKFGIGASHHTIFKKYYFVIFYIFNVLGCVAKTLSLSGSAFKPLNKFLYLAQSLFPMIVEFLDDISDGGRYPQVVSEQLIRLYDFGPTHAERLKEAIQNSIAGKEELNLSSLEFIIEINCKLTLQVSKEDKGITTKDKCNFVCSLTSEGYKKMIDLIEPYCRGRSSGHQWLYDLDCTIDFLLSPDGTW